MEKDRDIIDICDDLFYTTGSVGIRNLSSSLKEMDKQIAREEEQGVDEEELTQEEEEELEN